ncbi:hypothetical protein QQM39_04090 [Streptomyces sp. DT2A-34]|uniref:hypothetical protein n=1 Tax=Streptomyces sp. DT2A-34 TaxID=3051182 RepID=UPI00265C41C4|nr:hypothetical protein [Streptomyces sp. DT2A-34]MDO0910068.1 hypothetical protein [Streptomyces sp. DT2A-34]
MSAAPVRFHDPLSKVYEFTDSVLVRCPRCEEIAHYEWRPAIAPDAHGTSSPQRRLVCRSCGLARTSWGAGGRCANPVLWLQTETRHGVVWAYNLAHLDLLSRFVAASLRERPPWYEHGRKMTYVARLPAWIKRAKNRDEVLRAIDRIRASVVTG